VQEQLSIGAPGIFINSLSQNPQKHLPTILQLLGNHTAALFGRKALPQEAAQAEYIPAAHFQFIEHGSSLVASNIGLRTKDTLPGWLLLS
jgi:hypothetical protein